jgi:hypothetical protein
MKSTENKRWFRGHVHPYWTETFKSYKYKKQPITQEEINSWRSQGYTHESFTGVMYDSTNPIPSWCHDVSNKIGIHNPGFVFYKMVTGDIMPPHVDHFRRYCEVFNVERNDVWRGLVFLDDWKPGHYFEIDGIPIMEYKKGDYMLWSADTPHAASNIGVADRYTLQITGTLKCD